jgi:hypothetical protein
MYVCFERSNEALPEKRLWSSDFKSCLKGDNMKNQNAFRQSILAMQAHEIFDLVEACYTYTVLWHGGQWSDLYALQCEIGQSFKPRIGWLESQVEEENEFYPELNEDNIFQVWKRCGYVLENRWDDMV